MGAPTRSDRYGSRVRDVRQMNDTARRSRFHEPRSAGITIVEWVIRVAFGVLQGTFVLLIIAAIFAVFVEERLWAAFDAAWVDAFVRMMVGSVLIVALGVALPLVVAAVLRPLITLRVVERASVTVLPPWTVRSLLADGVGGALTVVPAIIGSLMLVIAVIMTIMAIVNDESSGYWEILGFFWLFVLALFGASWLGSTLDDRTRGRITSLVERWSSSERAADQEDRIERNTLPREQHPPGVMRAGDGRISRRIAAIGGGVLAASITAFVVVLRARQACLRCEPMSWGAAGDSAIAIGFLVTGSLLLLCIATIAGLAVTRWLALARSEHALRVWIADGRPRYIHPEVLQRRLFGPQASLVLVEGAAIIGGMAATAVIAAALTDDEPPIIAALASAVAIGNAVVALISGGVHARSTLRERTRDTAFPGDLRPEAARKAPRVRRRTVS